MSVEEKCGMKQETNRVPNFHWNKMSAINVLSYYLNAIFLPSHYHNGFIVTSVPKCTSFHKAILVTTVRAGFVVKTIHYIYLGPPKILFFPEIRVPRKIFSREAANLFFLTSLMEFFE